jgi:hypothetical protein
MEFKGTKGVWRLSHGLPEITTSREGILEGSKSIAAISTFSKSEEEVKANALLISKAPEMLNLFKKILIHVDWTYENWTSNHGLIIKEEINQLIKEATENN